MRSRLRRVVKLGPLLFLALAALSGARTLPRAVAGSFRAPSHVAACSPSGPSPATPAAGDDAGADVGGTWWHQRPDLDEAGSLVGWTLTLGSPRKQSMSMSLPPGSIVTGPDRGRVVATTDDGTYASVRIIDAPRRCFWDLPVAESIARRAIFVPEHDEVIAHLLDRTNRHDLGIWRLPLSGTPRTLVLPPPAETVLRGLGIEQVWATDMRLSADGTLLAVQSCDPHACLTRVLDFGTQIGTAIEADHGTLIGFVGTRLITQAVCAGAPCDILAWDLGTGRSNRIATETMGAAISVGGELVIAIREADGTTSASTINLQTGARRGIGQLERGTRPQDGIGTSGIEADSNEIGLIRAAGPPTILTIDPPAASWENRR